MEVVVAAKDNEIEEEEAKFAKTGEYIDEKPVLCHILPCMK